jgi:hypothetical protein
MVAGGDDQPDVVAPAGRYRGSVALNTLVPGQPAGHEIAILALDAWESCWLLRGMAALDPSDPFWFPASWRIDADDGSVFAGLGSGGGSGWTVMCASALAEDVRRLRIFIGSEGLPGRNEPVLAATPRLELDLAGWPPSVRRVGATRHPDDEAGPRPVPVPRGARDGPVLADRVVAINATLDAVARDLSVLSIDVRSDGFVLHLAGDGHLWPFPPPEWMPRLSRGWEAKDDLGGRYAGTVAGSQSGYPWTVAAAFAPTLDPAARSLTLLFPHPVGPGTTRTTVAIPVPAEP